ncbi:MAG: alpha/beta hydrolase [Gemmataceae bacterium]|nr:alpha/beta hydrolase [Gemmataceae bacterium]MCI0742835.1 alpha/beta hydrolase [Gemmataceae bacterium]
MVALPPSSIPQARRLACGRAAIQMLVALGLLAPIGCRVISVPFWRLEETPSDACPVEQVRDVKYCDGALADERHTLDLYLPKGKKGFPVVVLVHGGAWLVGDNRCCGLYTSVGEFLAGQGIAAVLPKYRLSPRVRHPEHARDVARAVAWTKKHIADYGGRPDQLFLAGHSAGGHLVALVAADERYLNAEGLGTDDLRGVVAISGVYRIPPGKMEVTLGGTDASAFHLAAVRTIRREPLFRRPDWLNGPGIPLRLNIFGPAFGDDPEVREQASPITHVRAGMPPILLVSAENDLPTLPEMAKNFQEALAENGCEVKLLRVQNRSHNSILFRAISMSDPVGRAVVEFVRKNCEH